MILRISGLKPGLSLPKTYVSMTGPFRPPMVVYRPTAKMHLLQVGEGNITAEYSCNTKVDNWQRGGMLLQNTNNNTMKRLKAK